MKKHQEINKKEDIFLKQFPTLDLHGEIEKMVEVLVNEFVKDNYLQKNKTIIIIHGKGSGIVKNEALRVLKENEHVINYKLNNWNTGVTIVTLDI